MIEAASCPMCDQPLPKDAPAGLCPRCLLQTGRHPEAWEEETESPESAPAAEPPPSCRDLSEQIPQLEFIELIGRGGMGAVYRAQQRSLGRTVAVKVLPKNHHFPAGFEDRFVREARALAHLNHPNIVTIYDFGESKGRYYLTMEYVDGATLRELIDSGEMTSAEAMALVPQVCEALQFAHEHGVVHRDVKPENILVDRSGRVKVVDFGLAKLLLETSEPALTQTQDAMGTPRYMAPEQIERSREVDHRADIYSLGVVLYELLTGEVPMGQFDPPSARAGVNARLDDVVLRSLAREPSRRYQHVRQVKTDWEAASRCPPSTAQSAEAPAPVAHPPKKPPQVATKSSNSSGAFAALIIVVVAIFGFLGLVVLCAGLFWSVEAPSNPQPIPKVMGTAMDLGPAPAPQTVLITPIVSIAEPFKEDQRLFFHPGLTQDFCAELTKQVKNRVDGGLNMPQLANLDDWTVGFPLTEQQATAVTRKQKITAALLGQFYFVDDQGESVPPGKEDEGNNRLVFHAVLMRTATNEVLWEKKIERPGFPTTPADRERYVKRLSDTMADGVRDGMRHLRFQR